MTWRRARDSNPRYRCRYTAFPVPRLRPLGQLSNEPYGNRVRTGIGFRCCAQRGNAPYASTPEHGKTTDGKAPTNPQPTVSAQTALVGGLSEPHTLAESEGFEPPVPLPVHLISSQAPSTTRTALQTSGADTNKPSRVVNVRFPVAVMVTGPSCGTGPGARRCNSLRYESRQGRQHASSSIERLHRRDDER